MNNDSTKQTNQERTRRAVIPQHQDGRQERDHSINTPVPPPPKKDK